MKKDTVVATFHSEAYKDLADITLPTVKRYCDFHDYDLFDGLFQADWSEMCWARISVVFKLLHEYKTVLWIDGDAMITNHTKKLDELPGKFVIAADYCGLNTGIFLARDDKLTMQFLFAVCGEYGRTLFGNHFWHEQAAIIELLKMPPYNNLATYVEQNRINTYLNDVRGMPEYVQGQWQPGDFILHLTGLNMEQRLEHGRKHAAMADEFYREQQTLQAKKIEVKTYDTGARHFIRSGAAA